MSYAAAPGLNPSQELITGIVRVEEVEQVTTREIRCIDKLINELCRERR